MSAETKNSAHVFYVIASMVLVVAALYLARDVLIPTALAIFLSFLLAPLANRLEWFGLRQGWAAVVTVALAFVVILGVGFLLTEQFISLAQRLPQYEDNIRAKIEVVRGASASILDRTTRSLRGMTESPQAIPPVGERTPEKPPTTLPVGASGEGWPGAATTPPAWPQAAPSPAAHTSHFFRSPQESGSESGGALPVPATQQSVPVRIVGGQDKPPLEYVLMSASAVLGPLGTSVVVVVLTIFILVQRRDLRDRLIALTGRGQILVTTQAFDEMSRRISRYLLMQLVVNTCYAIPLAIGLALFGIPNALLWGLMGLLLRFVPYVGAWMLAGVAVLLAIAVSPGWWGTLGVLFFLVVLELILNNVIEPWLYSVGTGISVLGVIFMAVFWTWLWGPVGLLLATPIGVCLTVMGRYIRQLEFIDTLMGGQITLEAELRLYQRLLAGDRTEAMELTEEYRRAHGLLILFDDLLLPTLQLAEQERHRGLIDEQKEQFLQTALREIIDSCAEHERRGLAAAPTGGNGPSSTVASAASTSVAPSVAALTRVLCIPAGDEADELAGLMLEHLLRARGYEVDTAPVEYLSGELVNEVRQTGAKVVFISALPPAALVAARYLCKRISSRWSGIPLLVGLWQAAGDLAQAKARLEACGANTIVTRYAEAVVEVARAAQSLQLVAPTPAEPTPIETAASVQ